MKFEWALQQMREGKKVKLPYEPIYIYYIEKDTVKGYFLNSSPQRIMNPEYLNWASIICDDWQLYNE